MLMAMYYWSINTCISFVPYNDHEHSDYGSYAYFQKSLFCGANIGYSKDRVAKVYLDTSCQVGNVIHELGHIIGFRHEHNRIDRDIYVKIKPNIAVNQRQYKKYYDGQTGYYDVPYDLSSIMHYSSRNGKILAVDPDLNFLMGQRDALSFLDIEMANKAYNCSTNCFNKIPCQNGGFLRADCKCFCPEGLTGETCEAILTTEHKEAENEVLLDAFINGNPMLNCEFENESFGNWFVGKRMESENFIINVTHLDGLNIIQEEINGTIENSKCFFTESYS